MSADDFGEEFDEYERKVLDTIDKSGCYIPVVFDPDGEEPTFAYSVGFPHTVQQGEVIVFGLTTELLGSMINNTLRQCREDGLELAEGTKISGLLEGFDVIARGVHPSRIEREFLNSAIWHHMGRYGEPLSEVYQLVWPSSVTGLFPWEEGVAQDVIDAQPPLYEAAA
ncbi:MAG: DUF4262 domain-containing protein [Pseudomonadota bacterium]